MKKRNYIVILLLVVSVVGRCQKTILSFGNQNLLNINPSFAGSNGLLRVQSATAVGSDILSSPIVPVYGSYQTATSVDAYIKAAKAGIALDYSSGSNYGKKASQQVRLSYAQWISFFKGKLKLVPSLQIGYGYNWQYELPEWYTMVDYAPLAQTKKTEYGDLGAGLLLNFETFYIGFSNAHIYNRKLGSMGFGKIETVKSICASNNFTVGKNFMFNLGILIQPAEYLETGVNLNTLIFKHFMVGSGVDSRTESWNASAGYRHSQFSLQLLYSQPIYRTFNGYYTMQLSASYNLRNKENRQKLTNFETW